MTADEKARFKNLLIGFLLTPTGAIFLGGAYKIYDDARSAVKLANENRKQIELNDKQVHERVDALKLELLKKGDK